jgi:Tfp pilus assembly protein PilV
MNSRRSKMCSKNRQSRERGIALISVLWALLLLSGLAGAAAFMARTEAVLTHKMGEFAQAESTTDAALVNAIAMLSDEKTSRHPQLDGQPQSWEFHGIPVMVSISNEAGRIDVNTADDDLILAFLYSQGISETGAATMRRDLRAYQRADNGPAPVGTLRMLEELKKIPSWAAHNPDCWNDSLTVYTGLPNVNASEASGSVALALKWASDHRMSNREWANPSASSSNNADRSLLGEVIRITASTAPLPGVTASSEWIGRLTGDPREPALTMRWSHKPSASNLVCRNSAK